MRIYFVNQYARDAGDTRDLSDEECAAKPYRCFTYMVITADPQAAIEHIQRYHRLPDGWTDVSFTIQNPDGNELDDPMYIGCSDVTYGEVSNARRDYGQTMCQGHQWIITDEDRCICVHCGADGNA